jgi:hypothetical protein
MTGGASGAGGAPDECDPTLPTAGAPPMGSAMESVAVPWTTSFEDGFCGYVEAKGYCYVDGDATYELVDGPAHTGTNSVAFSVNSDAAAAQTRCVRQGVFPRDAYYGAWFYLDARAESAGLWNLMFFQGNAGNGDGTFESQWDVSIGTDADGVNSLFIFDHVRGDVLTPAGAPPVQARRWFHVELRIRRAADDTGVAQLYQDDELIYETQPLTTDTTAWGQWYVGNLARGRTPAESTVYVDDVSIRAAP